MEFEKNVEAELVMPAAAAVSYSEVEPVATAVPIPVAVPAPVPPPSSTIMHRNIGKGTYMECLKNHAVAIGGHSLDGCAEFLPAGAEGTLEALKCAACNCHRNFHRKERTSDGQYLLSFHHRRQTPPPPPQPFNAYYAGPAGYQFHHVGGPHHSTLPPTTPPGVVGTPPGVVGGTMSMSSLEDMDDVSDPMNGENGTARGSKKRFRTKFTPDQKVKMLEFSQKLGWRMQKHDDSVVEQFCSDIGVDPHVLKVWMHNNKHTLGKKP